MDNAFDDGFAFIALLAALIVLALAAFGLFAVEELPWWGYVVAGIGLGVSGVLIWQLGKQLTR